MGYCLRMVFINCDPWFIAKDIADILGYPTIMSMTKKIDCDEVMLYKSPSMSYRNTIISERGVYDAILGSESSEAKDFEKFITHVVLKGGREWI
jgi:anti-repressor protein